MKKLKLLLVSGLLLISGQCLAQLEYFVFYDGGDIRIFFNTGTYRCGLSNFSRDYVLYVDDIERDRYDGGHNQSTSHIYTIADPDPNTDYEIRIVVTNPGRGTCSNRNSQIYDERFTVVGAGLSDLAMEFDGATSKFTWDPGEISDASYRGILEAKSSIDDGNYVEYTEITIGDNVSTVTVPFFGQGFPSLLRGLDYRFILTQTSNLSGGEVVAEVEFSVPLASSHNIRSVQATSTSSGIDLTWQEPLIIANNSDSRPDFRYIIERHSRPYGSGNFNRREEFTVEAGSTAGTYTLEDDGIVQCEENQYVIHIAYDVNGQYLRFKEQTSSPAVFPSFITSAPTPINFASGLTDACADDVELIWEENIDLNPCQEYFYVMERFKLVGSSEVGRKIIMDKNNNPSIIGGEYAFFDEDTKDKDATYRYKLKYVTILPNGNEYASTFSTRDVYIRGDLEYNGDVTADIDVSSSITVSWDDLSNEDSYTVIRKFNGEVDHEFDLPQNSTSFTTSLTDAANAAGNCINYVFEVVAKSDCEPGGIILGTVNKGTDVDTDEFIDLVLNGEQQNAYQPGSLDAYKGFEQDFVKLTWEMPNQFANMEAQKVYRRDLSGNDKVLIASLDPGLRSYEDREAAANTMFEYSVVAELSCGTNTVLTNEIFDVGYRVPNGLINGKIDFTGGVSVQGARVIAENDGALNLNKSVRFDGDRDFIILLDESNTHLLSSYDYKYPTAMPFLFGDHARTIEFWANPSDYSSNVIFRSGSNATNHYMAFKTPASSGSDIWQLDLGGGSIIDIPLTGMAAINEWHHFAITYDGTTLSMFVDGTNVDANNNPMQWDRNLNTAGGDANSKYFIIGTNNLVSSNIGSYDGYLDEFRVWDHARTEEEINDQKGGFLLGNESGLSVYLRMDENFGDFVYDASYDNSGFNKRHGAFIKNTATVATNSPTFSPTIPSADQLGYTAFTDANGNYTIKFIRYRGSGELFNLIPFITNHEFRPSNRTLFIGNTTPVHNEQDFEDISAFEVTGTIFYGKDFNNNGEIEDTPQERPCPAPGIFLEVDGQVALRDGQPVTTNENGEFTLTVPIGDHFIGASLPGHTFAINRWPETGKHDFQQPVLGVKFVDTTTKRVAGRVVGGKIEADKNIGFGLSKNNIGQATLVFETTCFQDTVITNINTGEYIIDLFPLEYTVKGGADVSGNFVRSNPALNTQAPFDVFKTVDLSANLSGLIERDTLYENGEIQEVREFRHDFRNDYILRTPHQMEITSLSGEEFAGEEVIITQIGGSEVEYTVPASEFPYPVFHQNVNYAFHVQLEEYYTNYDGSEAVRDTVPVTDGQIEVANDLADLAPYTVDMITGETTVVFTGGTPNLTENPDPTRSFLKPISVTSFKGLESNTWNFEGYILGAKQVGNSFTTQGPEVPLHILRDPPGSNSFASITKGTELTSSYDWSLVANQSADLNIRLGTGLKLFVGVGVATGQTLAATLSLNVSAENSVGGGQTYEETIEIEEEISTSDDPNFVGAASDLYIGRSMNMDFGVAEYLQLIPEDRCGGGTVCGDKVIVGNDGTRFKLGKREGMFVNPSGYDTYFIYTEQHILNQLIPDLINLRNQLLETNTNYLPLMTNKDDPRYGTNNDDPIWGADVTTNTPNAREYADFGNHVSNAYHAFNPLKPEGPSYVFSKIFEDDEDQIDSVRWYNQQIKLWRDAISSNEEAKLLAENPQAVPLAGDIGDLIAGRPDPNRSSHLIDMDAVTLDENVSFSSGSSFSRTVALSSNFTSFTSWELTVSTELVNMVKAEGSGAEFEQEGSFAVGFTRTGGKSQSQTTSTAFSFTLQDDNPGDFYSVDIKDGGPLNGPIFVSRGGKTACPYEGEVKTKVYKAGQMVLQKATIPQDRPKISISPARLVAVPSDEEAVFTLSISNENPDETRVYDLELDDSSNPEGAILFIDGDGVNRPFEVPAGATINKTLTVFKGPNANDYEGITLTLKAQCEDLVGEDDERTLDQTSFSVSFIPTCSDVAFINPVNSWVVNDKFNDIFPIAFSGYDINFEGLEEIKFQYKLATESTWSDKDIFYNKDEAEDGELTISRDFTFTSYDWNISSLPDGNYDLRLVTVCGGVEKESQIISGLIDRVNPSPFGQPSPADGILSPNDEISIRFNEEINQQAIIKNNNFIITGVLNGGDIRHDASVFFGGASNQYMRLQQGINLSQKPFTIDFYLKRKGSGEEVVISQGLTGDNALTIGFDSSDRPYLEIAGHRVTSESVGVTDGKWHHFAFTLDYSTQTAEIFIDGSTTAGLTGFTKSFSSNGAITIGKSGFAPEQPLTGNMHELRIWSKALTTGEVALTYLKKLDRSQPDLIHNWRMEEAYGHTAEDHISSKTAEVFADWQVEQGGRAYAFSGNQIITATSPAISVSQDLTVEFWVKGAPANSITFLSNGSGEANVGDPTGWIIGTDDSGNLMASNNGQTISTNTSPLDNNWHQVTLSVNRFGNATLYIDGNEAGFAQGSLFKGFGGNRLWMGARGRINGTVETIDRHFTGSIDEVRIWSLAKRVDHIKAEMYNQLAGDEPGLLLYYPFEMYEKDAAGIDILENSINNAATGPLAQENNIAGTVESNFTSQAPLIKLPKPVQPVQFNYSINGDQIILTTTEDNQRLEDVILTITVQGIQDLNDNVQQSPATWTAFVDKNTLFWTKQEYNFSIVRGEPLIFDAAIQNRGGSFESFLLTGLPDWISASPIGGTIDPLSSRNIRFTVNESVGSGSYTEDIIMQNSFGFDEKLIIDLDVTQVPPSDWVVNAQDYQYSMSVAGRVRIDGDFSRDGDDIIAAFVGNECRGLAPLEYVEELDNFQASLSIFSNEVAGEPITYQVWNASDARVHTFLVASDPGVNTFSSDGFFGTPINPIIFEAGDHTEFTIDLLKGWQWLSFNLASTELSDVNAFMTGYNATAGDQIKSIAAFDEFDPEMGWLGSLSATGGLNNAEMYKMKIAEPGKLKLRGLQIDPRDHPVNFNTGWTWISFLGREVTEVNEALANMTNLSVGDRIKGQKQFATFGGANIGWIGDLQFLEPGQGYMILTENAGSIVYPMSSSEGGRLHIDINYDYLTTSLYQLRPEEYANNMNLIMRIKDQGATGDTLIATIDGEVRGIAVARDNPTIAGQTYFMTVFGEDGDGTLTFSILNNGKVTSLSSDHSLAYATNASLGKLETPVELHKPSVVQPVNLTAYPNPFVDWISIRADQEILRLVLLNISGQIVKSMKVDYQKEVSMDLVGLRMGTYLMKVETVTGKSVLKIIKN